MSGGDKMDALISLLVGALFGLGLVVSEMIDPAKVLGFLDLAGSWDPSLALVMGGAVVVGAIGFALAQRRSRTLLGTPMRLPVTRRIDTRLVAGSAMFGAGWGLVGFCPGPAIAAVGAGEPKAMLFVLALLAGMGVYEFLERRRLAPEATLAR
jgi:uncharacterized membrane protein YedE/YeeE